MKLLLIMALFFLPLLGQAQTNCEGTVGTRLVWEPANTGPDADGYNIYYDLESASSDGLQSGPVDAGNTDSTLCVGKKEFSLLPGTGAFINGERYCFEVAGYAIAADGTRADGERSPRNCGLVISLPLAPGLLGLIQ